MDIQTSLNRRVTPVRVFLAAYSSREYLAVGFVLLAATLLLHGSALDGFWRWDDGAHLGSVARYSAWEYFFIPELTRSLAGGAHVTPWNPFFYKINLMLFGLHPQGHYAHLLVLIAMGSTLFYAVLRQWLPWLSALAGALALLLGKPTIHIAQGLMHGHYATGLIFSLLAILGWVRFLNGGRAAWLWLATFAYLLATTCKEVYVPLVALLPFLPAGSLRQRLRALWPFVLVALFYVGWRYAVLGHLLGGYRPGGEGFDAHHAMRQLAAIPQLLTGTRMAGSVELAIFSILFVLAAWRKRINWPLLVVLAGMTLLPLVPLTTFPGIYHPDRYLFVFWVMLAGSIAVIWPAKPDAYVALFLGAMLLVLMGVEHIREEKRLKSDLAYWDTLYRAVLSTDARQQGIYIGPDDDGYRSLVLTGAQSARILLEPDTAMGMPVLLADSIFAGEIMFSAKWHKQAFLQYDAGKMVPLSPEGLAEVSNKWSGFLARGLDKEIRVDIRYENDMLHWKVGPYPGQYFVLSNITMTTLSIQNKGSIPWQVDRPLDISVCYVDQNAKWAACSPRLRLEPKDRRLYWSGQGIGAPEPVSVQ